MGQNVQLRQDWDAVKDDVMLGLLRQKFTKLNHYGPLLLETHPRELIEGNYWHDNYWGDCKCPKCIHVPGSNKLGHLLEQVRTELMSRLALYQQAINKIDDYFEYRYLAVSQEENKNFVMRVLDKLTANLAVEARKEEQKKKGCPYGPELEAQCTPTRAADCSQKHLCGKD